jgi:hypothetical protein
VFEATLNLNPPVPLPVAPDVMDTKLLSELALHTHPALVLTETCRLSPPSAATDTDDGETLNVHWGTVDPD